MGGGRNDQAAFSSVGLMLTVAGLRNDGSFCDETRSRGS